MSTVKAMTQQLDYGQIRRWRGNNRGQILMLGVLPAPSSMRTEGVLWSLCGGS